MGLNKSKGNMYDFVTHTWNPLGGECSHKCTYCSTSKLMRYPGIKNKYTGDVRLIKKELKTQLGKDNFIFVCAQHDLFALDVKTNWIEDILEYCDMFYNKYLFQSKNPGNILNFKLPKKSVVCTTIETNRHFYNYMRNSPNPWKRASDLNDVYHEYDVKTFVTIEPIMNFDLKEMIYYIETCLPEQVNIGADSGRNKLPEPSKEKILELISELEKFTKVVQKKNLNRLLK